MSCLNATMSYYPGVNATKPAQSITLSDLHGKLQRPSEKVTAAIAAVRATTDEKARRTLKSGQLPCVTPSGVFSTRGAASLVTHSGLYCYDLDYIPPDDIDIIRLSLSLSDHVALVFTTPQGDRLKVLISGPPAPNPQAHTATWIAILDWMVTEQMLRHAWVDQSGKDVSRQCYLSDDPGALLHGAVPVPVAIHKEVAEREQANYNETVDPLRLAELRVPGMTLALAEEMLGVLSSNEYAEWVQGIMALKTQWGNTKDEAAAVELAERWSAKSDRYNPGDAGRKWRTVHGATASGPAVTMHMMTNKAKAAGWVPAEAADWEAGLLRTAKGDLLKITDNIVLFLQNHKRFSNRLRFDEFSGCRQLRMGGGTASGGDWVRLEDHHYTEIQAFLESLYLQELPKTRIQDAVLWVCAMAKVNSLTTWLMGLQWDGVKRVHQLFSRGFTAEATQVNEAFSTKFMVSAVARGMHPGCQVDTMPVLVGEQGLKKSTGWRVLFGDELFGAGHLPLDNAKAAAEIIQGKWCYEMSELTAMRRADRETAKGWITNRSDTYRPAYGREAVTSRRICVFVGTGNDEVFLNDYTGNRRFWPVQVRGVANTHWLNTERDQLWAEAVRLYLDGQAWWFDNEDAIAKDVLALQEDHRDEQAWEQDLVEILEGKTEFERDELMEELALRGYSEQSVRGLRGMVYQYIRSRLGATWAARKVRGVRGFRRK